MNHYILTISFGNVHLFFFIVGLLYIIDSNDRERMAEAREELCGILENDEMRNVPLIVVANKQDLPSK